MTEPKPKPTSAAGDIGAVIDQLLAELDTAQALLMRLLDHAARSEGCARARSLGAFVAPLRPDGETVERVILALQMQGPMVSSDELAPGLEPVLTPTGALSIAGPRLCEERDDELTASEIPPISLAITVDGIPGEPLDAWQAPARGEVIELDGGGAARVVDVVWVSPTDDSTIRVARIFATTIDGFGREPVPEGIDF